MSGILFIICSSFNKQNHSNSNHQNNTFSNIDICRLGNILFSTKKKKNSASNLSAFFQLLNLFNIPFKKKFRVLSTKKKLLKLTFEPQKKIQLNYFNFCDLKKTHNHQKQITNYMNNIITTLKN